MKVRKLILEFETLTELVEYVATQVSVGEISVDTTLYHINGTDKFPSEHTYILKRSGDRSEKMELSEDDI